MNPNIQRLREERDMIKLAAMKAYQNREREKCLAVEREKESSADGIIVGRTWAESASYRDLDSGQRRENIDDDAFWIGPWKELLADVFKENFELMSIYSSKTDSEDREPNRRTIAWRKGFLAGVKQVYEQVNSDGSNINS